MKKIKYLLVSIILGWFAFSCSDNDNDLDNLNDKPLLPNKEYRGTWISTAWGIDWPMGDYTETAEKALYIQYLDLMVANNMNTVLFQVRPMQGLFYESDYESWSAAITNTFGKNPGWDVMGFLIDEAHKRGLEFHAWFNPYRIATKAATDKEFTALDPKIPEDLVVSYSTIRMYNPALPEVAQRIGGMIKEILTKYDVDGIHIDDYFYPEDVTDFKDKEFYANYGADYATIEDFRRGNVNAAINAIRDAIVSTKPTVAFSVSPAASISKNYSTLYADVVKWSENGWVDIMIPQLYNATGAASGKDNFNANLFEWSQFTYNNLLAVGYGIYKFDSASDVAKFQTNADLSSQFAYANGKPKVKGSFLYSARNLVSNPVDIMTVIHSEYQDPTFTPYIGRPQVEQPLAPTGVTIHTGTISWNAVDSAEKYAVYRSNGNGKTAQMIKVTTSTSLALSGQGEYFVTTVGKYNIESEISTVVAY